MSKVTLLDDPKAPASGNAVSTEDVPNGRFAMDLQRLRAFLQGQLQLYSKEDGQEYVDLVKKSL